MRPGRADVQRVEAGAHGWSHRVRGGQLAHNWEQVRGKVKEMLVHLSMNVLSPSMLPNELVDHCREMARACLPVVWCNRCWSCNASVLFWTMDYFRCNFAFIPYLNILSFFPNNCTGGNPCAFLFLSSLTWRLRSVSLIPFYLFSFYLLTCT